MKIVPLVVVAAVMSEGVEIDTMLSSPDIVGLTSVPGHEGCFLSITSILEGVTSI